MHRAPNKCASGKGGIPSLFHAGRTRPALPEHNRSISMRVPLLLALVCGVVCGVGCSARSPKSPFESTARSRLEVLSAGQSSVEFLKSLNNLPPSVREKLAPIADYGCPFSTGCTGSDPHRRFLAATRAGGTYNVAVEHGGEFYNWFVVQFVVEQVGKVVQEGQIERDGAANGSQPIRSETNRTSSAAGSRR